MDDQRIWAFERDLWIGDPALYDEAIDDACLMVLPSPPFVVAGAQASDVLKSTPRWTEVDFSDRKVSRPQEGLIVAAYTVRVSKPDGESFEAHCTTTYRRLAHEEWRVIQHQQTPATTLAN